METIKLSYTGRVFPHEESIADTSFPIKTRKAEGLTSPPFTCGPGAQGAGNILGGPGACPETIAPSFGGSVFPWGFSDVFPRKMREAMGSDVPHSSLRTRGAGGRQHPGGLGAGPATTASPL